MPSVAIRSPGLTTNISPISSSLIGIVLVIPFTCTSTSEADNLNNSANADPALRLALCSKYRPNITKKIRAEDTSA